MSECVTSFSSTLERASLIILALSMTIADTAPRAQQAIDSVPQVEGVDGSTMPESYGGFRYFGWDLPTYSGDQAFANTAFQQLQALRGLGTLYLREGQLEDAENVLSQAVSLSSRIFGDSHPDTLYSLSFLADNYMMMGKYDDSKDILQKVLEINERSLGPLNPDSVRTLGKLGEVYASQGKYSEAEVSFKSSLERGERVFGANNVNSVNALYGLGEVYLATGRYGDAEPLLREGVGLAEQYLGSTHPETLVGISKLGDVYKVQGRYQEAKIILEDALATAEPDTSSPQYTLIQGNLAEVYARQGNLQEAERLYREIIDTSPFHVGASRAFAGLGQYPPGDFAAYGIVAFPSRAASADFERHLMICQAYAAALPHTFELEAVKRRQMVTIWPLENTIAAETLNFKGLSVKDDLHSEGMSSGDQCDLAVRLYDLRASKQALKDAMLTGVELKRAGPYLLAWSPSAVKGNQDALVLTADLTDVTTYEQARDIMLQWSIDIESNPELWEKEWDLEAVRRTIRLWVDKYGSNILSVLGT